MKQPYALLYALILLLTTGAALRAQCTTPALGNSATEDRRVVTLTPTRVPGATGYRVALTEDAIFGDPTVDPDTTYEFGPLDPMILYGLDTAKQYRVNLQAICGTEVSPFSSRLIFTTEGGDRPLLDDRDGRFNYIASASTGCFATPGSTREATNQGDAAGPCGGDPDDDVWYSFSPVWPKYTFTVDPVFGTDTALVFEIYDQRQDTLVACTSGAPGETLSITLENIPVNREPQNAFEYDMRVYTVGAGGYAAFEICAAGELLPVADESGCVAAISANFDGTGEANEFIDIVNAEGEVIVSIENTQPLGQVDVSYYENPNGARVFGPDDAPYLGRNVSITPAVQPAGPVRVRSYLTGEAIDAFIEANNLASDSDFAVTKVADGTCSEAYTGSGVLVDFEDAGLYGDGYFIDVTVDAFSEFFFHTNAQPLGEPVGITENGALASTWGLTPNPVSEILTLTPPDDLIGQPLRVEVFSSVGQQVLTRTFDPAGSHRLSMRTLTPGMYVIVLRSGARTVSSKIVKN